VVAKAWVNSVPFVLNTRRVSGITDIVPEALWSSVRMMRTLGRRAG